MDPRSLRLRPLLRLGGALLPRRPPAWAFARRLPGAAHGLPGAPGKVLEAGRRVPRGFGLLHLPDVDDDGDEDEFDCHIVQRGGGVPRMQLASNRRPEHTIRHLQQLLVVFGRGAGPFAHVCSYRDAGGKPSVQLRR